MSRDVGCTPSFFISMVRRCCLFLAVRSAMRCSTSLRSISQWFSAANSFACRLASRSRSRVVRRNPPGSRDCAFCARPSIASFPPFCCGLLRPVGRTRMSWRSKAALASLPTPGPLSTTTASGSMFSSSDQASGSSIFRYAKCRFLDVSAQSIARR